MRSDGALVNGYFKSGRCQMSVTIKLSKTSNKEPNLLKLRLQTIRLRKMLENTRAVIDLIHDGKEKLSGEYIFDRHYNVSLIDKIIERTRGLIFDSSVLAPEESRKNYIFFDKCKDLAEEFLLQPFDKKDGSGVEDDVVEVFEDTPEYKMLSKALAWADDPGQGKANSVMTLITNVFDHVFSSFEKNRSTIKGAYQLEIKLPHYTHQIELVDLGEGIREDKEGLYTFNNLQCRPLRLMMEKILEKKDLSDSNEKQTKNWFAIITDCYLRLQSVDPGASLYLEAAIMNNVNSDFIFLYSKDMNPAEEHLSSEYHFKKSPLGRIIWTDRIQKSNIEKDIDQLFSILFSAGYENREN